MGVGSIQPRDDEWSLAVGLGDGTQEGTGLGLLKLEVHMGTACCLAGPKEGVNSGRWQLERAPNLACQVRKPPCRDRCILPGA